MTLCGRDTVSIFMLQSDEVEHSQQQTAGSFMLLLTSGTSHVEHILTSDYFTTAVYIVCGHCGDLITRASTQYAHQQMRRFC